MAVDEMDEDATVIGSMDVTDANAPSGKEAPDAKLVCQDDSLLDESQKGLVIVLTGDREQSIGRGPKNDVQIGYEKLSRSHARCYPEGGFWWIEDLNSTNGVSVAGTRIKQHQLKPGDDVGLGSLLFRYELERSELNLQAVQESVPEEDEDATMMFSGGAGGATEALLSAQEVSEEEKHQQQELEQTREQRRSEESAQAATQPGSTVVKPSRKRRGGMGKSVLILMLLMLLGGIGYYYPHYKAEQELRVVVENLERDLRVFSRNVENGRNEQLNGLSRELDTLRNILSKSELAMTNHCKDSRLESVKGRILFLIFERQLLRDMVTADREMLQQRVLSASKALAQLHGAESGEMMKLIRLSTLMVEIKQFSKRFPEARRDAVEKPSTLQMADLKVQKGEFIELKRRFNMVLVNYPLFANMVTDTAERDLPLLDAWGQIVAP